ncbi:MAG: hypothetical protein C0408_05420 [Odoribacter sp.]|nr:hypothetical protein [Odoribacter sp.]
MIVYLKNPEIDRVQWDYCITESQSLKPYAFSWYLDIMAPGWEALVDDDYDSVFPVPGFRKYGIQYVATPIFLQQLGAFSPDKPSENAINEFLDYMPEFYRLIDLCVGQKVNYTNYRTTERSNYELDLSFPYEKLWNGYTSDCRRNILIGEKKKNELTSEVTPEELINLFAWNKGVKNKGIKLRDYERLNNLMNYCISNNKGKIIGVRVRRKLIYGVFLVQIPGSITILFTTTSPESRDKRTGYFVINEIIRVNAMTETMLDFAGSSIPSIASFMESFGSRNAPYYRLYRNRLPWPIRMLK